MDRIRVPWRNRVHGVFLQLLTVLYFLSACPLSTALSWKDQKGLVLYMDVDNTLYDESQVRLERQIVRNIHKIIDPTLADELHALYGSTIAGLDATQWAQLEDRMSRHQKYYGSVYRNLAYKSLLSGSTESKVKTGYDHQRTNPLRLLLKKANAKLHLASNSPRHHVESVLQALGMTRVPWSGITTPDASNTYMTKLNGPAFLGKKAMGVENAALIDDSARNLESFATLTTIHCNNTDLNDSILVALGKAFGWLSKEFVFSDVDYLEAKNQVDRNSIHQDTWNRLKNELVGMPELTIVDLGAGLLSMLDLGLHGTDRLAPLWDAKQGVNYYAFEPNRNLELPILRRMEAWGFQRVLDTESSDLELIFRKGSCVVHVCFQSYEDTNGPTPHLIMGCCFADLHDPDQLVPSIIEQFLADRYSHPHNSILLYFPITFQGTTQFWPPQPFQGRVPSDTLAFQLYSRALEDMGHHLDPCRLVSAIEDYGGNILAQGPSAWSIGPDGVFWDTMLYFFGTACAPKFTEAAWHIGEWLERARRLRLVIQVSNTDLLFRLPLLGQWSLDDSAFREKRIEDSKTQYEEILFTAPREVTIVKKKSKPLQGDEVRIEAECSLISTGTELKVFSGQFDDAPLDLSIDSMTDERLRYPLAYGYSLVGTVVECGIDLDSSEWIGRRVFCFNAHASQAISKASAVQLIPDDCDSLDAIFMPSVETALSMVQEARPILGENVGVFGQGLIGLLVTSLLNHFRVEGSNSFGIVTTYDNLSDRVMLSSKMQSAQALRPGTDSNVMFDVAIEVSGNGKALQAAIAATRPGGRIVVGSWYGNSEVPLRLDMDFHRSHKTLIASQVSDIPALLSGTWSKARRFQLTWELVKTLRPSRLLTKQVKLCDAHDAYTMLESGQVLSIAFRY